ncbi:hypothetical protein Taro_036478, partial [Colocasia esculenta]|nr:hypothetical protein [Colocasia esculenta]
LFEFITYLTVLNSNPLGLRIRGWRRDLRGPWRGSKRSGRYSGIRAQGSNEICNELITMAVSKKGTSTLLARPCGVGMLVCRVSPLVEHCYTCLWLLSAFCWLVVNSSELLPEFFSVGSGGKRCLGGSGGGSPRTCLRCFCSSACCSVFSDVSRLRWWDFVCPCGRVVCFASHALRALPDGGLRPVACLLPPFSMGCSGWWCSTIAFGAALRTMATFVAKVASFPAVSGCELQESVATIAGCVCFESGLLFRSGCGWLHPRFARLCGCVAKAERPYVWCGLHRCRVVVYGTGRRCPSLVGCPLLVGVCPCW